MARTRLESVAEYGGLATVAVEWLALLLYYLQLPQYFGWKYPISHYATLAETRWIFVVCYVLAAICFWIFVRYHLTRYYRVPLRVFGVSLLLFAGTGVFPYDPGDIVSVTVHTLLALSSGLTFVLGMYLVAQLANDKLLLRVTLSAIALSLAFTSLLLFVPSDSHLIFTFEACAWLFLQLWMIWFSFYVRKRTRPSV